MRGAALSDLHLGFRAYSATDPNGANAREMDVIRAWERCISDIVAEDVDLVTIAGDVFHHPRVGARAIAAWLRGLRALSDAGIRVVVIPGNHDAARGPDVVTPVDTSEAIPGVYVLDSVSAVMVRTSSRVDVRVTGIPYVDRAPAARVGIEPDPGADVNVLVIHAAAAPGPENGLPRFGQGADALRVPDLGTGWDLIHLGDFHDYHILSRDGTLATAGPSPAFYSGAPERTTTNPWREAGLARGWVLWQLETDTALRLWHRVVPTRRVVDVRAEAPDAAAANFALAQLRDSFPFPPKPEAIDPPVVRLVLDGFRGDRYGLDWPLVREIRAQCLHFQVDVVRAVDNEEGAGPDPYAGAGSARAGLESEARKYFKGHPARVVGIAREALALDPGGT